MDGEKEFDEAWRLRTLHHVATGLNQLHQDGIAHQDIKPSNILLFEQSVSKIGDLGRSVLRGEANANDALKIPGAQAYAPPELLYGDIPVAWDARRYACDAYLFASMVVFLFANVSLTALLFSNLSSAHRPKAWTGSYEDVLPYLRDSFAESLDEVDNCLPTRFANRLRQIIEKFGNPDYRRRGETDLAETSGSQYSLYKTIAQFDLMARYAEQDITLMVG